MEPENRHSCVSRGSTSRLREPVTGRQERPNSSTRSHNPITDIWKEIVMTSLKKRLAVLALGLAVTALASPSYARGAGRDIRASDPTTLLAPPTPQAPLENRIPAPLSAPAQAPTINGPLSQPAFRGLTGIGQ